MAAEAPDGRYRWTSRSPVDTAPATVTDGCARATTRRRCRGAAPPRGGAGLDPPGPGSPAGDGDWGEHVRVLGFSDPVTRPGCGRRPAARTAGRPAGCSSRPVDGLPVTGGSPAHRRGASGPTVWWAWSWPPTRRGTAYPGAGQGRSCDDCSRGAARLSRTATGRVPGRGRGALYGRDQEAARLAQYVAHRRLTVVSGRSGSGKIIAGARRFVARAADRRRRRDRPARHRRTARELVTRAFGPCSPASTTSRSGPLATCDRAGPRHGRVVLFLDQFEEVAAIDPALGRQQLAMLGDLLSHAPHQPGRPPALQSCSP